MLTIDKKLPAGGGLAPALLRRAATLTLDWDLRQRSRIECRDDADRRIGIFLPRGSVIRGGDVLVASDGSLLRVVAAEQPVMMVSHCPEHGSPFDLLRAAYHLGNRHVALELQAERLLLEPDPVLAGMLRRMHLIVVETRAPFEPESGAYASEGQHRAHHDHDHDHHRHGHAHDHRHDHGKPRDG